MGENIELIIAGSSRVRDLQNLTLQNDALYNTTILPNPGGSLITIAENVIEHVRDINNNSLVVIYVIGGLCDITQKTYHRGGYEITLRDEINTVENARKAKSLIRQAHPNAIVSFASIAPAHLKRAKEHYKKHNHLWESLYDEETTQQM